MSLKQKLLSRLGASSLLAAALCLGFVSWSPGTQDGDLVGQLHDMNVKMRNDVTRLINSEARDSGFSIRRSQLVVSSIHDQLVVCGAPVSDAIERAKSGRAANQEGKSGEQVIGVIVTGGKGLGVSQHGKGRNERRYPAGGMQTGTFFVVGKLQEGMSSVKIVGADEQVITEVKLERRFMANSNEQWWRPIYMSILNKLLPMVK